MKMASIKNDGVLYLEYNTKKWVVVEIDHNHIEEPVDRIAISITGDIKISSKGPDVSIMCPLNKVVYIVRYKDEYGRVKVALVDDGHLAAMKRSGYHPFHVKKYKC